MRGMIAPFIKKILVFILPLAVLSVLPTYVLRGSGENFLNIDRIIGVYDDQKFLVGYAYNQDNHPYIKYRGAVEKKGGVLALGSSRVLQFRQEMFTQPFYNAGMAVRKITDFESFLRLLPKESQPQYLLMGIDQWMMQCDPDGMLIGQEDTRYWTENQTASVGKGVKNFVYAYQDLWRRKIDIRAIVTPDPEFDYQPVGLQARYNHEGLRNDGSYAYGVRIDELMASTSSIPNGVFSEILQRVKDGGSKFPQEADVCPTAVEALDSFLAYAQSQGVFVVGFLPPIPEEVATAIDASGQYGYIKKLAPTMKPVFDRYGFEFYAFQTMTTVGADDSEAIDGLHGGEKTYLRLLLRMLTDGSRLNTATDAAALRADVERAINRYVVYPY